MDDALPLDPPSPAEAILSRDQILAVPDLVTEKVAVPEWGGAVFCRNLVGSERDSFEAGIYTGRGLNLLNARARLCALGICDAQGKSLFTVQDVAFLGQKNSAPMDRCYDAIRRLSGMSAKDIEELEKNLEPAPGAAS